MWVLRGSLRTLLRGLPLVLLGWAATAHAQAAGASGIGALRGVVRSETGVPVAGATVTVDGSSRRAVSAADGRFTLVGLPSGAAVVQVRAVGYSPLSRELTIPVGSALEAELVLTRAPVQMATVVVTERREPYDARLAGFRQRVESRSSGYLFTRERIEATANRSALDLMRGIPGVRIVSARAGSGQAQSIRFRSNRCPPVVFIDGHAASVGEFDLSTLDLHMVEGVEVYLSSTTLPPEFFAVSRGQEQCGVIAVWSRPTQLRAPRPATSNAQQAARVREAAFPANAVDEAAFPVGGSPEIVYPDSLWRERASGSVTLEFVVDARGNLNWSTIKVLAESHPYFTRAVMEGLARARWMPAVRQGRRVAQLVVLPVEFSP